MLLLRAASHLTLLQAPEQVLYGMSQFLHLKANSPNLHAHIAHEAASHVAQHGVAGQPNKKIEDRAFDIWKRVNTMHS